MRTEDELYEIEVLDGEVVGPVRAELEPATAERLPGRLGPVGLQTAVAAATGFVAGAATLALLRRYGQTRLERTAPAQQLEPPNPARVRTYVVHVRQLG